MQRYNRERQKIHKDEKGQKKKKVYLLKWRQESKTTTRVDKFDLPFSLVVLVSYAGGRKMVME